VLVIEDDDDNRDMLVMLLRTLGHEVSEAATGREGIEEAARARPEIVLVDVGLPDLNGYEVGRQLRQTLGPNARLVAVTGHGQSEDRMRSARAGFDQHLVKPIDPAALAEILPAL
jgi:CheY-like chemotaxis protein